MQDRQKAQFEQQATIMKALAHPTRLFIVDELARQERCVCELVEMIGADISTVSKHLSVLKNAGFVQDDKRGTQVFYHLRCSCVANFFDAIRIVLENNAQEHLRLLNRQ